jgi:hypothetical protein
MKCWYRFKLLTSSKDWPSCICTCTLNTFIVRGVRGLWQVCLSGRWSFRHVDKLYKFIKSMTHDSLLHNEACALNLHGTIRQVKIPSLHFNIWETSIYLSSYLGLYIPLLDLGCFQFLNPIHRRWDSLDGGSARRKAAAYTQNNTNTE